MGAKRSERGSARILYKKHLGDRMGKTKPLIYYYVCTYMFIVFLFFFLLICVCIVVLFPINNW
jgi:hypothetical protein